MAKKADLPKAVLEYFAAEGRRGGKTRAKRLTPEQRSAIGRRAAQARWARQRRHKSTG